MQERGCGQFLINNYKENALSANGRRIRAKFLLMEKRIVTLCISQQKVNTFYRLTDNNQGQRIQNRPEKFEKKRRYRDGHFFSSEQENGVIKEFCNDTKYPSAEFNQENGRERIIFIKNEQGEYEFYGLYQCEVVNSTVKPFERKYVLLQEIL